MKIVNVNDEKAEKDEYTFSSIRKEILRDEILLILPHNTDTKQFYAGVTTVYPSCRSRGHAHEVNEEICFITKGKGVVEVDDGQREVA